MAKIHWRYGNNPERNIAVYIGGTRKIVTADNSKFEDILQALKDKETPEIILAMIDKAEAVNRHCRGLFEVRNGVVYIGDREVPDVLSDKIIQFTDEDIDVLPLVNFWKHLSLNPSYRAQNELFRFLEANSVPIVDESEELTFIEDGNSVSVDCSGFFVAWKAVREDFKDGHTGTFDNSPGMVVKMPRHEVDDNPNNTCSSGLHVAAWDYAKNFMSDKYIKVYVNPADVVSVPIDYNNQKMRTCRYYVFEEVEPQVVPDMERSTVLSGSAASFVRSQINDDDDDQDEYDDDNDDDFEDDDEDWLSD